MQTTIMPHLLGIELLLGELGLFTRLARERRQCSIEEYGREREM